MKEVSAGLAFSTTGPQNWLAAQHDNINPNHQTGSQALICL